MSTYFIVMTSYETPRMFVSQQPLGDLLRALRGFPYSHTHRSFVYSTNPLAGDQQQLPVGCVEFAREATIEQNDVVENYMYAWLGEIHRQPLEQAKINAAKAQDYLNKVIHQMESSPAVEPNTTGP